MKRSWQRRLSAVLMTLVMAVSLMPAVLATEEDTEEPAEQPEHSAASTWSSDGANHWHACTVSGCSEHHDQAPHTPSDSWSSKGESGHEKKCTVCDYVTNSESHHISETISTTTPASCYQTGKNTYACTDGCGYSREESIPATGEHVASTAAWASDTTHHWHACTTSGCPYAQLDRAAHSYPAGEYGTNATQHWQICSVCGGTSAKTNHTPDSTGKCTACKMVVSGTYTVTFQYLSTSLATQTSSTTVTANGYATAPSATLSQFTYNGTTYTFKGWTTTYRGSSNWYLYSTQSLTTLSAAPITGNTTFYAVYTASEDSTITYKVAQGEDVTFDAADFNAVYQKLSGSSKTISYVTFTGMTGYVSATGTLYCGSKSFTSTELRSTNFYYSVGSSGYGLDELTFSAASGVSDGASVTLSFRAYYNSSNYQDGTVQVVIDSSSSAGDIIYTVAPGGKTELSASDFNQFFQKTYRGYTVSYVTFDTPTAAAYTGGTIYHNYGTTSSTAFTRTALGAAKFYYQPGTSEYGLGALTFSANSSFTGPLTLTFTAYGSGSRSVSGKLVFRSSGVSDAGEMTYTVNAGKSVALTRTAFNTLFKKVYAGYDVSYVVFDRPDSSTFAYGTLYSDYGASTQTAFTQSSLSSAKFYYDASSAGSSGYDLNALTFVAGSGFRTKISLAFTAYGTGSRAVRGTLVIQPGTVTTVTSGDIVYSTVYTSKVQINANDISRYFKKTYPSGTLQYVTLGGVPSTGGLYYNYYGASKYGTASSLQLTSSNYVSQSFYFSPASTSQYALSELTYVPSGYNYCAAIPFTAYGTGSASVSGTILISSNPATVSEIYGVTPKGTAVTLPLSSVTTAVSNATGITPTSIQFLSLPASTAATLYSGAAKATVTEQYTISSSSLQLTPASGYTGSVELPYVAYNSSGTAITTGKFCVGVITNLKTFSDVKASTWCYKYVEELSDAGVIAGYSDGTFRPNSKITYGAALKLIMLAAGYSEQKPVNSNVFSGYLAKAREDGLITRSNVDLTKPITRLQVAQLAAGALKLDTTNLSSVKPFTDTDSASVQALNAAGIVEGYFSNGTSTFKPNNNLTRGQVSAIVWRMRNYLS